MTADKAATQKTNPSIREWQRFGIKEKRGGMVIAKAARHNESTAPGTQWETVQKPYSCASVQPEVILSLIHRHHTPMKKIAVIFLLYFTLKNVKSQSRSLYQRD
ncbi:MAG: hypothetical protein ACAI35_04235 [Candidatus Methylacidiphilales bacterium]|nr:hypothetical protein [Candidatus Methylacidiphilales bacterium]